MRAKKAEEEKGALRNTCRLSKEPATKNLQPQYTARSRQTNAFYVVHVFQKAFIFPKVPRAVEREKFHDQTKSRHCSLLFKNLFLADSESR